MNLNEIEKIQLDEEELEFLECFRQEKKLAELLYEKLQKEGTLSFELLYRSLIIIAEENHKVGYDNGWEDANKNE